MKIDSRVFVCTKQKSGVGDDVVRALRKELKAQDLKKHTRVQTCNCLDLCKSCKKGPGAAIIMHPDGTVYGNVRPADAADIVGQHVGRGAVVARLQVK